MKVGGLAVGLLRTTREFVESTEWGAYHRPVVEIDDGAGGVIKAPAPPWRFSDSDIDPPVTVARRGEHNVAILSELGFSEGEIKQLEAEGVLSLEAG